MTRCGKFSLNNYVPHVIIIDLQVFVEHLELLLVFCQKNRMLIITAFFRLNYTNWNNIDNNNLFYDNKN